jgi:hypothetical protein
MVHYTYQEERHEGDKNRTTGHGLGTLSGKQDSGKDKNMDVSLPD